MPTEPNLSLNIVIEIGVAAKVIIESGVANILLTSSNKPVFPIPLGPYIFITVPLSFKICNKQELNQCSY